MCALTRLEVNITPNNNQAWHQHSDPGVFPVHTWEKMPDTPTLAAALFIVNGKIVEDYKGYFCGMNLSRVLWLVHVIGASRFCFLEILLDWVSLGFSEVVNNVYKYSRKYNSCTRWLSTTMSLTISRTSLKFPSIRERPGMKNPVCALTSTPVIAIFSHCSNPPSASPKPFGRTTKCLLDLPFWTSPALWP